jgi:hypothetical protein
MTDFDALLTTLWRHEVAFIVVGGAAAIGPVDGGAGRSQALLRASRRVSLSFGMLRRLLVG